jgi:hypothetical protein
MDHFALFMLEPGKVTVPDQRCMLRLVLSLLSGHGEAVLVCMPVPVQAMVGLLKTRGSTPTGDSLLTTLMSVWWEYNNQTPFMAHHLTAKLVRRMVKDLGRGAVEALAGMET